MQGVGLPLDFSEINLWLGLFMVQLSSKGHEPGYAWAKDFCFEYLEFLKCLANVSGETTLDRYTVGCASLVE